MRLKKRDLILQEMMTLLRENRSMSVKELSEIISSKYGVDPSYISKIKSELESDGTIRCEVVGRTKIIHLVEPENKLLNNILTLLIPVVAVVSALVIMNVPLYSVPNSELVHAGLGENIQIVYIPTIPKNMIISSGLIGFAIGYFVRHLFSNKGE